MIGKAHLTRLYRIEVEYFQFDPKYSVKYKLRNGNWFNSLISISNPEMESLTILDKFANGQLPLNSGNDFEYFYELYPQVKSFKIWSDGFLFIESSNPNEYVIEKRCDCCGHKLEE